jgi:hypothetical protein
MGRDSASSAQSKRAGTGLKHGSAELRGGGQNAGGECKVVAGEDGVVGDTGGVHHAVDVKTTRFGGFWGILGGWDTFRGCSSGSDGMFRHF